MLLNSTTNGLDSTETVLWKLFFLLQTYGYLLSYYWNNDYNVRKALRIRLV